MARQENPVELAQKLVSYLDSSNGETQPLFAALESLRRGPKAESPPFDLDSFETHIEQMDAALNEAWDVLEEDEGDTPLMSETYINWRGEAADEPEFCAEQDATALVRDIDSALRTALDELAAAWDIVADGTDVPTSKMKGDYGAYDSLTDYIEYVHSQAQGMCRMTYNLERAI